MLFRNPRLETTMGRASLGLLIGAVSGALMNAAYVVVSDVLKNGSTPNEVLSGLLIFGVVSSLFWLGGAFLLATPGWAVLHAMNLRGPGAAVLYGVGLLGGLMRLLTPLIDIWTPYAVAGGIVGLIVWGVSYRPQQAWIEVSSEAGA
ncbi:hypothetical protein GVN21_02255 [Caulobacter sp. SLTY]|uniref:hypothetical protein n=1 Tax=Caulobacter sp. SLTY TaxID=2683262 RepID=UPI001412BED3|nr:hypothetical protein [Caulobacter sp. SLTY]NBB14174.1 hypothetical protein [Caulobacter sp. SLTY]